MSEDYADIEYADGYTPCPWCDERPSVGEPWNRVHVGTARWDRACFDCAMRHDNGFQAPKQGEAYGE